MSTFNFDTFGAGRIPPSPESVFVIKDGKYEFKNILSEDIEDVDFVEVSNAPKASCNNRENMSYDKSFRSSQIIDKAFELFKEMESDAVVHMSSVLFFMETAEWVDDLPRNKKSDKISFSRALQEYIKGKREKLASEYRSLYKKNLPPAFILMHAMTLSHGGMWAFKNPPKYY